MPVLLELFKLHHLVLVVLAKIDHGTLETDHPMQFALLWIARMFTS